MQHRRAILNKYRRPGGAGAAAAGQSGYDRSKFVKINNNNNNNNNSNSSPFSYKRPFGATEGGTGGDSSNPFNPVQATGAQNKYKYVAPGLQQRPPQQQQ